jgi:tellurite resistance protein TerC
VEPKPDPIVDAAPAGKWLLTPLAVALILVEVTDLIFAVDSIPAVFAITADPFLVFTSNVFAILGLRSLYFALAGLISKFRYLKPALSLILVLVGVKMLAAKWLKIWLGDSFNLTVLAVIIAILATGIITSIIVGQKDKGGATPS